MDALKTELQSSLVTQPDGLGAVATDHPVFALPFTAEIDGRQCKGEGLSLVRAEVAGLLDPALEGQERLVRLGFAFQGFAVALNIPCRVTGLHAHPGHAVLVFSNPTGDHLPQLRHVLNAFVAGDLVSLGQILGVAASQPGVRGARVAGQPAGWREAASRAFGTGVLLAATLGLIGAVATLSYARLYTHTLPVPAQVQPQGQMLTALAAGQIDYLNPQAKAGEVAFSLKSQSGQVLSVAMPCDCAGVEQGLAVGSTVLAGQPVLLAHAADAPLSVQASVPAALLYKLTTADSIQLRFADGTVVAAHPALPLPNQTADRADAMLPVTLLPDQPLPAAAQGALAEVQILFPTPALLSPARALYQALGG